MVPSMLCRQSTLVFFFVVEEWSNEHGDRETATCPKKSDTLSKLRHSCFLPPHINTLATLQTNTLQRKTPSTDTAMTLSMDSVEFWCPWPEAAECEGSRASMTTSLCSRLVLGFLSV